MSRCVILSACPVQPELKRLLRSDDFIIACDAGYRNCVRLGCKPDIIVGDFDSAPCPQQDADDIVVLPHVKDDTDTEYAAKLAAQKGFDEVLLLGALGGRPEAERRVLCLEPEYSYGECPVRCVQLQCRALPGAALPVHKDYLGSLMGLALKREALGDILLPFPTIL